MTGLVAFGYLVSAIATALAWPVARLRPEHAPIAYLLTFGLASDLVRRGLHTFFFAPAYAVLGGAPATGWLRLAGNVEQALFLGWIAGVAAAAMMVFLGRRPWLVALGYVAGVLGIALGYPAIRGQLLSKAYLGFELSCLMVATGCLLHWVAFRKETPRPHHLIVALIIGAEAVGLVGGAWRFDIFTTWKLEQAAYALLYSVITVINGGVLWIRPKSSRS